METQKIIFGNYKEDTMKNKLIAGLVLSMLAPVVANAAAINWTSERYRLYADLEANSNVAPTFDVSKTNIADLPFAYSNSVASANASASVELSIKNLSNSSQNIFELTNNTTTAHGGATQFAYAATSAEVLNTFIANTSNLYVTYDYSSVINMAPSTTSLSYQEVTTDITLRDTTNSSLNQQHAFVDDYVDNSGSQGPHNATNAGISYSFLGNGTYVFSGLTIGRSYELFSMIVPDMVSGGTIADNSSKSVLKVGFSDSVVTAVPEPETYVMLLTGLAFLGFSARRKQQG
jgi:hypothetical protein